MTPDDRKYAASHEWVKVEGDIAIVGISDYAQESLGDITFVELPDADAELSKGDETAVVESVKAASDIYAPIGGTVCAVNEALDDTPEMINEDCYNAGWIYKLQGIDQAEMDTLLDAEAYNATIKDD